MLTTKGRNPYNVALENFDSAADALELPQDIREMMRYPERVDRDSAGAHG